MRIRSYEEASATIDYLDPNRNPKLAKLKEKMKNKDIPEKFLIGEDFRIFGIQSIMDFHARVKYNLETLFIACYIFDRCIMMKGIWNFKYHDVRALTMASLILAAKIEDPIGPNGKEIERLNNVIKYDE